MKGMDSQVLVPPLKEPPTKQGRGVFCRKELPEGWQVYPNTISGYRVNYSVRMAALSLWDPTHNEFWMIWTDLVPCTGFLALLVVFPFSHGFNSMSSFHRVLAVGVLFSAVCCRACSCAYHTFNCTSARMNQTLINLDLMGIASMALGAPWLFAMAAGTTSPYDKGFLAYVSVLLVLFTALASQFGYRLATGRPALDYPEAQQLLLLLLAGIGNTPALAILCTSGVSPEWFVPCLLCPALFASGYVFFYRMGFPERNMEPGRADGMPWNSHVIWHVLSSLGQLFYVLTPFMPRLGAGT